MIVIDRPSTLSHLNRFSTGAEWSILVLGFAKYSKRSSETQVSYTLKKHHRVFISRSIQNGCAFKIVVVSTGCAIAVNNTFNCRYFSILTGVMIFSDLGACGFSAKGKGRTITEGKFKNPSVKLIL